MMLTVFMYSRSQLRIKIDCALNNVIEMVPRVFSVGSPALWNILLSSRLVENIAPFFCHLNTYFYNLVYQPQLSGLSIHLLTTGIFIDSETDKPFTLMCV